jgi:polyhydroxybutyrate depolymerase
MNLIAVTLISIGLLATGSFSTANQGRSVDFPGPGAYERKPGPRVAGFRRSYRVHVPKNYDGTTPAPLVLALHGAFSGARGFERQSGLSKLADEKGFIVVYPNGIGVFGLFRHWNSGHCCGKALKDGIDDVGFVLSVLDEVVAELAVDTERVYLVGYSNGGMLAHRIAAERPESFVALGVVSGTIGGNPDKGKPEWKIPQPVRPLPVVMFHGRADTNVPYEGGAARGKITAISSDRTVALWVERNNCASEPLAKTLHGGKVLRESWTSCPEGAEVVRYSIEGWGHDWPGERFTRKLPADDPLRGFEAARSIWEFFKAATTP